MRHRATLFLFLLVVGLAMGGCESLQRKFTRKPKSQRAKPTAIIKFTDYSRSMTPMDRYRKHYMMFDYWNSELMDALQDSPMNPKRIKHASKEAFSELEVMQGLMLDEAAGRLAPFIEDRAKLNRRLQTGSTSAIQPWRMMHELERQTRGIHRDFFWRDLEDKLKAAPN